MSTATQTRSFLSRARAPQAAPDRILIYGVEGVGKSSFGAAAPSPIFLAAEDGIRHLAGVQQFPEPKNLADVYAMLGELAAGGHEFKTLVVDSVDWLDPIVARAVCERNKWEDLESPGYGKGYVPFAEEWRKVLAALDRVRAAGLEIILIGHAKVATFANPKGPDFSRYEVATLKQSAPLIKQWADHVFFANFDDHVVVARSRGAEVFQKGKGVSSGDRVLHTTHDAAWDAKARGAFPATIPLSYADFDAARAAARSTNVNTDAAPVAAPETEPVAAPAPTEAPRARGDEVTPEMLARLSDLIERAHLTPERAEKMRIFLGDRTDAKKVKTAIMTLAAEVK